MRYLVLLLIFLGWAHARDHSLYMPLNIQKAYANGTRSYDGQPGPSYWVNHAAYRIDVRFTPDTRTISGSETIEYFNESPDTLRKLVLRLYQDNRRFGAQRDWPVAKEDLHDGEQISLLKINDQTIPTENNNAVRRAGTNMIVRLDQPLPPRQSIQIAVNWQYVVSHISNIRNGCYDSTSCFIGYWYPQVAVYDDIDGWDQYNYTGLQEFYNDFSDFDVRITVPNHFVVWATGLLQNPEQVFPEKILDRYRQAKTSDQINHIITEQDYREGAVTKTDRPTNTWYFKARQVPDFAFALSDHYLWDLTSLRVEKDRRVLIGAAFKKESKDFFDVCRIARASIDYYSTTLPGVPFPFPALTVFNGHGGMEYPMMVNDGSAQRRASTVHVTSHEIAHSYFPFYMGINERKYAWMDEGWATMLPFELQHRLAEEYDPIARTVHRYESVAGSEFDLPMFVPTIVYGSNAFRPSYRNEAYNRSGMAYYLLQRLMGKEKFRQALQEYVRRWHGRHPIPYDFFFTFDQVYGQDLSWFWKPWFFEFGFPDLAIKDVMMNHDGANILIEKIGRLPVPVELNVTFADSTTKQISRGIEVWRSGVSGISLNLPGHKKILSVQLGSDHIPDANKENNYFSVNKK